MLDFNQALAGVPPKNVAVAASFPVFLGAFILEGRPFSGVACPMMTDDKAVPADHNNGDCDPPCSACRPVHVADAGFAHEEYAADVARVIPGRRFLGVFARQAPWQNDQTYRLEGQEIAFDATDAYLALELHERAALRDDTTEADNLLADSGFHLSHTGPYVTEVCAAIEAFHGSEDEYARHAAEMTELGGASGGLHPNGKLVETIVGLVGTMPDTDLLARIRELVNAPPLAEAWNDGFCRRCGLSARIVDSKPSHVNASRSCSDATIDYRGASDAEYVATAREQWGTDGEIEIGEDARVLRRSARGAFVQGALFVANTQLRSAAGVPR